MSEDSQDTVGEVRWCQTLEPVENKHSELVLNPLLHQL